MGDLSLFSGFSQTNGLTD
uniref:Uncharacterized protein n=1 Tax=Rhizophora mucronata TaxID=61149 RepID=A0A2P2QCR3_RHIMU